MKLLEIKDLVIHYETDDGLVQAVNGIELELEKGDTLGLVGETGAGKTTTALGILRLVPDPPGKIVRGEILFEDKSLITLPLSEMRKIRGGEISMIFQDPMTALNPVIRVCDQIAEMIYMHGGGNRSAATKRAAEMLQKVGIPPERGNEYPHQFSGGMKQRVVIAMALACTPSLIIADEPTTALDVTIQAQVLDMMNELKREIGTSMIMITHDLGVVAETCDKVAIMYAGEIVEYGGVEEIFDNMGHPYTRGLFASLPSLERREKRLQPIAGLMPDPMNLPTGCKFHPRCPYAAEECAITHPSLNEISPGHKVRCQYADKLDRGGAAG